MLRKHMAEKKTGPGRPMRLTRGQETSIAKMYARGKKAGDGTTMRSIATELGYEDHTVVQRAIRRAKKARK